MENDDHRDGHFTLAFTSLTWSGAASLHAGKILSNTATAQMLAAGDGG
ncbi:hypothetical protein [Undibacterium griseum]|uniref:Uncharacterized protein n=1 Tax=Undibacterium griseum TaxID=2762295 RepID=A0ABR6YJY0_9BURK|nr:hypothetical protein [Undibacterium griseum]MBC3884211.1 hypothetical protein [Undibacterium griseum]